MEKADNDNRCQDEKNQSVDDQSALLGWGEGTGVHEVNLFEICVSDKSGLQFFLSKNEVDRFCFVETVHTWVLGEL